MTWTFVCFIQNASMCISLSYGRRNEWKKNCTIDGKNVRKMETFLIFARLKVKNTDIMESHLAKCQRYAIARI